MIDWNDNAKAAVREFVEHIDEGDYLSVSLFPLLDNFLESRPTQPKTVADAVKTFPGGYDSIPYSPENIENEQVVLCAKKAFFEDGEEYVEGNLYQGQKDFDNEYFYLVCARAEFEAYVKEQEGEKWTHVTNSGYECNIVAKEPDENYVIVVLCSDGVYRLHDLKTLKPIKPTLTKAEAWDRMADSDTSIITFHDKYEELKERYDII